MNTKQLKSVNYLTSKLAYLLDGVVFTVEQLGRGEVMVSASNAGNISIYRESDFVLAIVGPRGGINIRTGSSFVRKMI